MNNRCCETRDATWQSGVARDTRTVCSRFAAVRPNKCPAWSTWKVHTDVLVNTCGSRTFLADRSGKASRAHSQQVGSWTRHIASGVRATYPNVESPRPAWPAHCSRYGAHFTAPCLDRCSFDTSRMLMNGRVYAAPNPNELNNYIPDRVSKSRITMAHCQSTV